MATLIAPPRRATRPTRRERRAERRRLKRLDALSARLADLHAIGELLGQAADVVGAGWVQGAWFTVDTSRGPRPLTAYDVGMAEDLPVVGACLVGAVVHAAGGPATVRSQVVQRTLELTRHVLREEPDRPIRWCPGPNLRMMTVLDLTYWNDAPGRTQGEVAGLLVAAQHTAGEQQRRCRAEQSQLDAVTEPASVRVMGRPGRRS
jgi:hypothetical protein